MSSNIINSYDEMFAESLRRHEYLLTAQEQDSLDPRGEIRARFEAMRACASFSPNPQNPLWAWLSEPDLIIWLKNFFADRSDMGAKYPLTWAYEEAMRSKFKPQGGRVPWSAIMANVDALYASADTAVYLRPSVCDAICLWVRRIAERVAEFGYPQDVPYTGFGREFSGCPMATRKAHWLAYHQARYFASTLAHPLPDVLGTRYYRGKVRAIHEDAFGNLLTVAPTLTARRNFLRTQFPGDFGSWLSPHVSDQPAITTGLTRGWGWDGFDYEHCDLSYTCQLMEKTVFPLWQAMTPSPACWDLEAQFLRELFWTPIFLGDRLLVGKHTLMNGTAINNDVETITDRIILEAVALELSYDRRRYHSFALGDDVGIQRDLRLPSPRDLFVTIARELGFEVNAEKQIFLPEGARYLRRTYEPTMSRHMFSDTERPIIVGAYPLTLTLNSLVHPEWPVGPLTQNVVASLQRLDNGWGHPAWDQFVSLIWSKRRTRDFDWDAVEATLPARDWFAKLYGESWSMKSSPTFNWLITRP